MGLMDIYEAIDSFLFDDMSDLDDPYAGDLYESVEWDPGSPWGTVTWLDGTTSRIHDDDLP